MGGELIHIKKDRSHKENGRKLEIKGLLVKQINGV